MKKKKSKRPVDPVTLYAHHVTDGIVLAGRMVRLACTRHLRDLERQNDDTFAYVFDPDRAERLFRFFEDVLTLDDGSPFVLMPWLKFIFGSVVGWVDKETGYRRFTTVYLETAKGTGKTPAAAGFGLFGLIADGEQGAEVYSLGVNGDQARQLVMA